LHGDYSNHHENGLGRVAIFPGLAMDDSMITHSISSGPEGEGQSEKPSFKGCAKKG
jgi:hypothetical protein